MGAEGREGEAGVVGRKEGTPPPAPQPAGHAGQGETVGGPVLAVTIVFNHNIIIWYENKTKPDLTVQYAL